MLAGGSPRTESDCGIAAADSDISEANDATDIDEDRISTNIAEEGGSNNSADAAAKDAGDTDGVDGRNVIPAERDKARDIGDRACGIGDKDSEPDSRTRNEDVVSECHDNDGKN